MRLKLVALWLCRRDPRMPLSAKLVAALVVAYALSPIDLIPDFIPVLGYLDDLLLVPAGIWLAIKLIPAPVWSDALARAREVKKPEKKSYAVAAIIVLVWLSCAWAAWKVLA